MAKKKAKKPSREELPPRSLQDELSGPPVPESPPPKTAEPGPPLTVPGSLTISRYLSGDHRRVEVALRDRTSFVEFARIELTLEDFTLALFGHAEQQGELSLRGLGVLGCKHEIKTVTLPAPDNAWPSSESQVDRELRRIQQTQRDVAPYEIDGWQADVEAAYRSQQPPGQVRVRLRRYVKLTTEEAAEALQAFRTQAELKGPNDEEEA